MKDSIEALSIFLNQFNINPRSSKKLLLKEVLHNFSRLPYENLTKIVKSAKVSDSFKRLRMPLELISDHIRFNTGGTCFSLTFCLREFLKLLGFDAHLLSGNIRGIPNNDHSLVLIYLEGEKYIADPGYLFSFPLKLNSLSSSKYSTPIRDVIITPKHEGTIYEVSTKDASGSHLRYTFSPEPLPSEKFIEIWMNSFIHRFLGSIVLSCISKAGRIYIHGHHMRYVQKYQKIGKNIRLQLKQTIHKTFGISPQIIDQALEIVETKKRNDRS
jgi:arylamine N-acetyltransferase